MKSKQQICCYKFEAMMGYVKRYKFKLDAVNWCSLFCVEGLTNAWTYSTRQSGAALKDICLRDILAAIDNCECERLREKFVSLSIRISTVEHTMITAQKSRRRLRAIRRPFFGYVDLKKKGVGYPSVMPFEGCLASGPEKICDLFVEFIQRSYTDDVWVASDPGPEHVPDDPPFNAL
jgi:hypothetical protein